MVKTESRMLSDGGDDFVAPDSLSIPQVHIPTRDALGVHSDKTGNIIIPGTIKKSFSIPTQAALAPCPIISYLVNWKLSLLDEL